MSLALKFGDTWLTEVTDWSHNKKQKWLKDKAQKTVKVPDSLRNLHHWLSLQKEKVTTEISYDNILTN